MDFQYEKLFPGMKKVVNCSGRMTYLGSSTLSAGVLEAMAYGGDHYFDMAELAKAAEQGIAAYAGAEGAFLTCGASSGIAIATAAAITRGDLKETVSVPHVATKKREVLIQKGHAIHFGASINQMIALGGGIVQEVGSANRCDEGLMEASFTENTAAVYYVQSHHAVQDGTIPLEKLVALAAKRDIPVIVDAAAEEDFRKYYALGADLVIYSGAKAFGGPTSGIIVGKKIYIDWCHIQSQGIARPFKVGKETILGIRQAVEEYFQESGGKDRERFREIESYLNTVEGVRTQYAADPAGRAISRFRVYVDEAVLGITAQEAVNRLLEGDTAVYTRAHHAALGYFEFDPRPMMEKDIPIILEKLKQVLK